MRMTQNQVYGMSANTNEIELTQNQVYGLSNRDVAEGYAEDGQYCGDADYELI